MTELKPYPKYKDSGVEWIGEIPEDWEVTKLKRIVRLKMGQSPNANSVNTKSEGVPFLQGNAEFTQNYPIAKQYSTETKVVSNVNDILLSVRAPVGAMNWSDTNYVIGRGLCSIKAKTDFNQKYLWYLLRVLRVELYSKVTGSTFEAVTISDVKESNVVYSDLTLQKKIANYLDRKTSEIDSLIAEKQKLIKLLEEKRQAIITETVTKGLNSNVKMKDSGIEWIGQIPEHWDIKKIKHVTNYVGSGKTPRGGGEIYSKEGVIFLRSQNIHYEGLKLSDVVYISNEINDDMENTKVFPNDILLNITGASIGRTCIVPKDLPEANVNQHVCIIRPKENNIEPELLSKIMASKIISDQIFMLQAGSSREGLNFPQIKSLIFPLSRCAKEHIKISGYIEEQSQIIYQIKNKVYNQIQKLQEYRESLIYEAVTGKIDLRNVELNEDVSITEYGNVAEENESYTS